MKRLFGGEINKEKILGFKMIKLDNSHGVQFTRNAGLTLQSIKYDQLT